MKIITWNDIGKTKKKCIHYNDLFKICDLKNTLTSNNECDNCKHCEEEFKIGKN